MNRGLFYKALIVMSIIGLIATVSVNISASVPGAEESLFSLVMSLIGVIFLAPFMWWISEMRDVSSVSEMHYYAAMFFDIVVYAYIIERLSTSFKNWKAKKSRLSNATV